MKCVWLMAVVAVALGSHALAQTTQSTLATRPAMVSKMPKPKAAKPTVAVANKDCASADCHAAVKDYKVVHGPVNVNACDACHKLTDAAQHKYTLARNQTEVCTFCHQIDVKAFPVVHKPVQSGDCLGCHNPHGGTTSKSLRGATMRDMCNSCHKDVIGNKKMVHGPVAAGACDSCHKGHGSTHPKLLSAKGRDMCLSCHTEMKAQMAKVKFTHKAVEKDCGDCHDAHASNYPMQIKHEPLALCTSCHEHDKIKVAATEAKYKHTVVTADKACLNCHTAHGGNLAKLMRTEPIKVCLGCHEKPIETKDGRKIASVAEVLDPRQVKHGPIRDGNCSGCHTTHGSDEPKLLVKAYPPTFYQAFSLEKYDLCFTCHEKQLALNADAKGLTNFRNGQENLHFVHVNKEKGRSCRACHTTHASPNELHVRDSVPYGQWQLPVAYKKTQTGGSCSPGCHKPYEYDRTKPVKYEGK